MPDEGWMAQPPGNTRDRTDPLAAVARAAAAVARLDHALDGHPLLPAVLYRARLDAVRRTAAVDGHAIDQWHLAAILEGLRLRMAPFLSLHERGTIFDAARRALDAYQWLVAPDYDQEGEVQAAEQVLAAAAATTPLIAGARGFHAWIDRGGDRRAGRAALIRFWCKHAVLRAAFPLVGSASLRPETPTVLADWVPAFLIALAEEAEDGLQLVMTLERAWLSARTKVAARRSTSRAALAVDILAAGRLVAGSSLGRALGMAAQNAGALLERFAREGIALEVSHRSKRRLYGLAALAPLRDGVAPPRRPQPGRGRGRPPSHLIEAAVPAGPPAPLPPLTPLERRSFDYSGLDATMAFVDEAVRHARGVIGTLQRAPVGSPSAHHEAETSGTGRPR